MCSSALPSTTTHLSGNDSSSVFVGQSQPSRAPAMPDSHAALPVAGVGCRSGRNEAIGIKKICQHSEHDRAKSVTPRWCNHLLSLPPVECSSLVFSPRWPMFSSELGCLGGGSCVCGTFLSPDDAAHSGGAVLETARPAGISHGNGKVAGARQCRPCLAGAVVDLSVGYLFAPMYVSVYMSIFFFAHVRTINSVVARLFRGPVCGHKG